MKNESGSVSLTVLIAAAVLCVIMVMITECCYIVTVRERVKAAAELALESAVEYCADDSYRSDESLKIDADKASERFKKSFSENLETDADNWHRDENGRKLWKCGDISVDRSHNGLEISAEIEIKPYLLTGGVFRNITVPVGVRAKAFINYNR